jgi:hypothetical protein
MVLVLCDTFDSAAFWAAECLRSRGADVEVVTTSDLEAAVRWEHRVRLSGAATIHLQLMDGRHIASGERLGVLNRLTFVPTARLTATAGADRAYAIQEMNAFFLSWLNALPGPVLNRAKPQGLGGNWRHPSAWAVLAGRAGLSSAPYTQSCQSDPDAAWLQIRPPEATTIFVVGRRVVAARGGLPAATEAACLRLAQAAGEDLLGIDFLHGRFIGASPRPDLQLGGDNLVDALADALAP